MDKRRILYLILFSVFCVLLGTAIYFVFFRKAPAPRQGVVTPRGTSSGGEFPSAGGTQPRTSTPGAGTIPIAQPSGRTIQRGTGVTTPEAARVRPIVTESISNATADASGAKFYSKSDGKFYRVASDGKLTPLSDQVFFNVQNVTWAPQNEESIIEYPDGSNIYYNFQTKKQVTLPKHWEEFSFAPTGDKIAAKNMALSPESRYIITANPSGTETTLVEPMGDNADKVTIDWSPNKQVVALSRTGDPQGADRQEVLFIGLHGENNLSTIIEGRDFRSEWSPEGKKLLYSVYSQRSDFKPELWIVNAEGESIGSGRKFLSLNTWADKCAFGTERYIYCGVPQSLTTGAGFAPDLANDTPDSIYRIDLQTGTRSQIKTDDAYTVESMFVGEDGKSLFFTDKHKSGLFKAPL